MPYTPMGIKQYKVSGNLILFELCSNRNQVAKANNGIVT